MLPKFITRMFSPKIEEYQPKQLTELNLPELGVKPIDTPHCPYCVDVTTYSDIQKEYVPTYKCLPDECPNRT